MIGKNRIFKRGDVIVSGLGNIRIFTGEKFEDDSYKCLACYCVSGLPAGTDMRYARHATAKEKKLFFNALKANGLCFDKAKPYKVVKKRVRPTLTQMRDLESGLENEHKLHIHFSKQAGMLKVVADGLETKVKAGLEQIDKLTSENRTLRQSNALMEEELERQKKANIELSKFNDQYKEELAALKGRGFWARVFNQKC